MHRKSQPAPASWQTAGGFVPLYARGGGGSYDVGHPGAEMRFLDILVISLAGASPYYMFTTSPRRRAAIDKFGSHLCQPLAAWQPRR